MNIASISRLRRRNRNTGIVPADAPRVDYLVGGFRISLDTDSNTPGPRTHIVNFVEGLRQNGCLPQVLLASNFPFMKRFTRIKQSDYSSVGSGRVVVADAVRIVAAVWCGCNVFVRTLRQPAPNLIYERVAVLQSLTSFHARKRSAVRVVEANGILSRETARDRKVLRAERLAAALERHALRSADLVVAVSERLKLEVVDFAGIDPARVLVVPNGVSETLLDYTRREHQSRVIGFVGSVVKWQNLEKIISMIAEVSKKSESSVKFEIIGDGAELENLRSYVREHNLGEIVTFYGRMPQSDAFEVMTGWDIGLAGHQKSSSGSMYHSPLKLYEYAALGLSIICTSSADAQIISDSGADVRSYANGAEFMEILSKLIVEPPRSSEEIESSRKAVVQDHSWSGRARYVLDAAKATV